MRSSRSHGSRVLLALAVASLSPLLASASPALSKATKTPTPKKPHAVTGVIRDFHGFAGTLSATVNPDGLETVYYFEYGPTTSYGSKTLPVSIGSGYTSVKVSQPINGLLVGFHYRVIAVNKDGESIGKDEAIAEAKKRLRIAFAKSKSREHLTGYRGSYVLSGTLTGLGSANHAIELQAKAYPFKAGFVTVGPTTATTTTGSFAFQISQMTQSTEFRVVALGARQLNSPTVTVHVAVNVTIHVRSVSQAGLARVYGTVSPAVAGGVVIELLRPAKETGKREATGPKAVPVGATKLKRATVSLSRFSAVVGVPTTGYYRVYVRLAKGGPLVSGYSRDILIRTHKPVKKKSKGKGKKKG